MKDLITEFPKGYIEVFEETKRIGFDQPSDSMVGALLASICASKPGGTFIELGTGTGLCTAWMLHGMCKNSTLTTVDNNAELVSIAKKYLADDPRVEFVVGPGEDLIQSTAKMSVDVIFADTWPGKYHHLEETLDLLKFGGVYIIDDMLPQSNWPEGHAKKVEKLIAQLAGRTDLTTVNMCWSTGIVIGVKNA